MALGDVSYRYVGSHAEEYEVGDKRVMVGMGDFVTLSSDDAKLPKADEHITTGLLIPLTSQPKSGVGGDNSG